MNRDRQINNLLINTLIDIMAVVVIVALTLATLTTEAKADSCRSATVKRQFDKEQGYPHGRKGYIVDHVCSLFMGGLDSTINMQYQTITESRAKDKIENTDFGAAQFCTPLNSTPLRKVFNCKDKTK